MGNQFLVYASDVTLLEKKINTTRKVTDDPFDASWLKKKKKRANSEKTKCIFMFCHTRMQDKVII
jgi:hypothetical protein